MDSLFGKLIHHHHSHHDREEPPQQQQQQMRREDMVTVEGSAPTSHVDDDSKKDSGSSITSSSIYKTVVEGTGAGYGDMKEYAEGESGLKERNDIDMKQQPMQDPDTKRVPVMVTTNNSHESAVPTQSPTLSDSPHHHHHPGPMEKLKHKVHETLQKVRSRKKKHAPGGEEKDEHSGSSSSSEDEWGEHHQHQ